MFIGTPCKFRGLHKLKTLKFNSMEYLIVYRNKLRLRLHDFNHIGLFLSNIDGGEGVFHPPYDFALTVEIGEWDTCT